MFFVTPLFVKGDFMTGQRRIYIEKIALDARERLVEKKIIKREQKFLSNDDLSNIVSFYGGKLEFIANPDDTCIKKIDENSYIIYYYSESNNYMQVIHELGHAFLNLEDMKIAQKYNCNGFVNEDSEAAFFARAFVMPRYTFEPTVIEHLNDGEFCIQNIADEYQIDYLEVLARGEELQIGR